MIFAGFVGSHLIATVNCHTRERWRNYYLSWGVCVTHRGGTAAGLAIDDEGVNREINEGVNEGVNVLLDVIRRNPGKRANELAGHIGKSVQSVERYVKALQETRRIEFRGAPKNGGYFEVGNERR